jgi:[glutamine synthetase] adenylyltransferase / [glutamine synthetase]-adenylyl-L-tyrosine phosphorylase
MTYKNSAQILLDGEQQALAYSRFLQRNFFVDSELRQWIIDHCLSSSWQAGLIRSEVNECLSEISNKQQLYVQMRVLRRRYLSLIAWADLSGVYCLESTIAAVSELADSLIDNGLQHLKTAMTERYGEPIGDSGQVAEMIVLALGKLGGRELNFSSDVDLIFAFTESGNTNGRKVISNDEFFTRLGRELIRYLDEASADGFVFRTDMRLRPNGASGPLALSFDAMEYYYQTHGRDWERYALIKMRPISGSEQQSTYLMQMLRPFVYRKYLDFGAFESIREMKNLIDRELLRKGRARDIKLGRGGIREIEFVVQCHQLIRGGRETQLQTTSLYKALDVLVELGVISNDKRLLLLDAYRFLRNTEHRLQIRDDLQTQTLPQDLLQLEELAVSMGFTSIESFEQIREQHQELIHREFSLLFEADDSEHNDSPAGLTDVWFDVLPNDDSIEVLESQGFTDGERCLDIIHGVRSGRFYSSFSRNSRERLDRLFPLALALIVATDHPDKALVRFVRVMEGIGRRSAYFVLLVENRLALSQLVELISTSEWIALWVSQHPVILDELLNPLSDAKHIGLESLKHELGRRLESIKGDLEAEMDIMREFKNGYFLRLAAMATAGLIEDMEVRRCLTDLAETVLYHSVIIAEESMNPRYKAEVADYRDQLFFGIVAYGKLGSAELSYHSDLDIVYLYDGGSSGLSTDVLSHFFSRLSQRLQHVLNTTTRAGILYETDIRLRPSGRSGAMVSSIKAFEDYQTEHAWTFEHQALVRARLICESSEFTDLFESARQQILCGEREIQSLAAEIDDMRKKMAAANDRSNDTQFDLKLGSGGMVDIEFISQYLVLRHGNDIPELLRDRSTVELLKQCAANGLIEEAESDALSSAFRAFLSAESKLKLQDKEALIDQGLLTEARSEVRSTYDRIFTSANHD